MNRAFTWILAAATAVMMAMPALAAVEIEEIETPGGLTAWLVEDHNHPFTVLELRFRGGSSLDAPDKRGAVYLMMGLLEEGAGELDSREHARALERIAASVDYDSSDDEVTITARFLTESRDEAMALLHDAIHDPHFDADSIERVRRQVLSSLSNDLKDPNAIAGRAFSEMAYGDHPYGSPGEGTIESVSALTREDIVAAHEAVFARDRVYIGAVGDITAPELATVVDDLLGDLPDTGAPLPGPADVALEGGVTVVPFATPQSVAYFGHKGIERDDPDFFAAYVLNHILGGGGFESRLMNEVREKRGLTYGVYSYLVPKDLAAMYMGSVASGNDRIAEAIEVIRDEWARMAEDGVTQNELDEAKTYLTGAYPLRFDGNGRIASIMLGMQMQDLPTDYIATRNDKVDAVTLEDVNRVARELLDPDALHFVVVGQPEGLSSTTGSEG